MVEPTTERIQRLEVKVHDTRKKVNDIDHDVNIVEIEFKNYRENMNSNLQMLREIEAETSQSLRELRDDVRKLSDDKLRRDGAFSVWKFIGKNWLNIVVGLLVMTQLIDIQKILHLLGK
jgi:chromosome segregation ATPase